MQLYLGVDLGTSYFKVGLFDAAGVLRGLGRVAVEKSAPAPGRCELDVTKFWLHVREGVEAALKAAGGKADQIAGISYSSQASTFVLLGAHHEPLTPLVMWTDSRGEPLETELAEFTGTDEFSRHTGFSGMSGQWAAAKWRWFQRHEPDIWRRTRHIMTISDYFTFALTGERVGDAGTAAFLGLYDLVARDWWPEALRRFAIEREQLSTMLTPGTLVGRTHAQAAERLGLPAGIPFAVGGLDHQIAALGSGVGDLADASVSTGTVLAALLLVSEPRPRAGCYHGPHVGGCRFYRLAFDPNGAGQLEDYQRRHCPEKTVGELIALTAGTLPPNPATAAHAKAIRTLMEDIAHSQHDLVRQIADEGEVKRLIATGGGARSALWLQVTADTLRIPVLTVATPECACLGAAMIAAVAAGAWTDLSQASRQMVKQADEFVPARIIRR